MFIAKNLNERFGNSFNFLDHVPFDVQTTSTLAYSEAGYLWLLILILFSTYKNLVKYEIQLSHLFHYISYKLL